MLPTRYEPDGPAPANGISMSRFDLSSCRLIASWYDPAGTLLGERQRIGALPPEQADVVRMQTQRIIDFPLEPFVTADLRLSIAIHELREHRATPKSKSLFI